MIARASARLVNTNSFKHSSGNLLLNDSMKAFSAGLPVQCSDMPPSWLPSAALRTEVVRTHRGNYALGVGVEEGVGDGVAVGLGTVPTVKLTCELAGPICVTELSHRVAKTRYAPAAKGTIVVRDPGLPSE